jgi:hypothetical protein
MTLDSLLRSGAQIVVLLEAQSSAGPRYASNAGYVASAADPIAPNRAYPDWLQEVPEVRQSLPVTLFGRSEIGWSDAIISNPRGVRDSWLDEAWDGRAVRLLVGAASWTLDEFVPVFDGVATGLQATADGALRLAMSDPREQLNRPVQDALIATGPSAGEVVPLCYGTVFNVEPTLIDAPSHTYRVHESAVVAIDEVYVGGLPVAFTDNADGTLSLGVFPAGRVTADLRGQAIERADALLVAIAARAGVTSTDAAALAALASAAPQPLGLYINRRTNAIDVLDEIAGSVGAWWGFDGLGRLTAAVAQVGVPALALTTDDVAEFGVQIDRLDPPRWRTRIGYRRNHTVQTDGLFAAVAEDIRQRLGREWDIAEASSGSTRSLHPLAIDPDIEGTLMVAGTDARAESARRMAMFGVPAKRLRVSAFRRAWALRPGDTVRVTHPRFGLAGSRDLLVLEVSRRVSSRDTALTLWAGGTLIASTPTVLATEAGEVLVTEAGAWITAQEAA